MLRLERDTPLRCSFGDVTLVDQLKQAEARRKAAKPQEADDSWLPLLAACLLGLTVFAYLCTSFQLNYDDEGALTDISAQRRDGPPPY